MSTVISKFLKSFFQILSNSISYWVYTYNIYRSQPIDSPVPIIYIGIQATVRSPDGSGQIPGALLPYLPDTASPYI